MVTMTGKLPSIVSIYETFKLTLSENNGRDCPLCIQPKNYSKSRLDRHFKLLHTNKKVLLGDNYVLLCKLYCSESIGSLSHYHCPHCNYVCRHRVRLTKHYNSCVTKDKVLQTNQIKEEISHEIYSEEHLLLCKLHCSDNTSHHHCPQFDYDCQSEDRLRKHYTNAYGSELQVPQTKPEEEISNESYSEENLLLQDIEKKISWVPRDPPEINDPVTSNNLLLCQDQLVYYRGHNFAMQTPGGSNRPPRRCGKPKRFDDTDSDEGSPVRTGSRLGLMSSAKRKVSFIDVDPESDGEAGEQRPPTKRQKNLTPKALSYRPSLLLPKQTTPQTKSNARTSVPLTTQKQVHRPAVSTSQLLQLHQRVKAGPKSAQERWKAKEIADSSNNQTTSNANLVPKNVELANIDQPREEEESGEEEQMESMLTEYRQMCGKPVVDMTKGNVMANGAILSQLKSSLPQTASAVPKLEQSCRDCIHYKEELDHLEEMIKLKDCELQQILQTINSGGAGDQKLVDSLSDNIEKRISYHKLYLESEKKLRSTIATKEKWEALYTAEAGKTRDLEMRCEALELKLKMEQKNKSLKPGSIEISASKWTELTEMRNYHTKQCSKLSEKLDMVTKENTAMLKTVQRTEVEYRSKFTRMKKHYQTLLEHYIQKDSRYSKRKDFLDRKMATYKDVGSRDQILRDAVKYLNANQLAFLEGQLSTEKTVVGKTNFMPAKYKELLLSIYQTSIVTYKVLKSYNFNIPPLLSIQQLSQSEVCKPGEEQYTMLNERSNPVAADRRTLRALCSDEEEEEIADLLDASVALQDKSIMSDEEAEDGVDGDYGDVQPEEGNEEEEEEGGADYLSDDEPKFQREPSQGDDGSAVIVGEREGVGDDEGDMLGQQEFPNDFQQQLDNQLSNEFTAEPQFETMEAELEHSVMGNQEHHHVLVGQVMDSMEHVVQDASHVDQLVHSIGGTIQNHQIEISTLSAGCNLGVDGIEEASTTTAAEIEAVDADSVMQETTTVLGENVIVNSVEAEASLQQGGDSSCSTTASSSSSKVLVNSAETEVAERGPDMPLL